MSQETIQMIEERIVPGTVADKTPLYNSQTLALFAEFYPDPTNTGADPKISVGGGMAVIPATVLTFPFALPTALAPLGYVFHLQNVTVKMGNITDAIIVRRYNRA